MIEFFNEMNNQSIFETKMMRIVNGMGDEQNKKGIDLPHKLSNNLDFRPNIHKWDSSKIAQQLTLIIGLHF